MPFFKTLRCAWQKSVLCRCLRRNKKAYKNGSRELDILSKPRVYIGNLEMVQLEATQNAQIHVADGSECPTPISVDKGPLAVLRPGLAESTLHGAEEPIGQLHGAETGLAMEPNADPDDIAIIQGRLQEGKKDAATDDSGQTRKWIVAAQTPLMPPILGTATSSVATSPTLGIAPATADPSPSCTAVAEQGNNGPVKGESEVKLPTPAQVPATHKLADSGRLKPPAPTPTQRYVGPYCHKLAEVAPPLISPAAGALNPGITVPRPEGGLGLPGPHGELFTPCLKPQFPFSQQVTTPAALAARHEELQDVIDSMINPTKDAEGFTEEMRTLIKMFECSSAEIVRVLMRKIGAYNAAKLCTNFDREVTRDNPLFYLQLEQLMRDVVLFCQRRYRNFEKVQSCIQNVDETADQFVRCLQKCLEEHGCLKPDSELFKFLLKQLFINNMLPEKYGRFQCGFIWESADLKRILHHCSEIEEREKRAEKTAAESFTHKLLAAQLKWFQSCGETRAPTTRKSSRGQLHYPFRCKACNQWGHSHKRCASIQIRI